nr:something about silencing protein 10 [Hymenolepis microstoma]
MKSKYYGGDDYDEKDDESVKLFMKDCHHRQTALNTIHPSPHSSISYLVTPLSKGELLYTSGQSRLHLFLRESSQSDSEDQLDFLIFQRRSTKAPVFPMTLDEEARVFRSHGLPLLVWPRNRDKATVQKYLDDNYPDCALWFKELDICQTWLNEKWLPLANYLGISTSKDSKPNSHVLLNLPLDCIAKSFIKERIDWLLNYSSLLESYLLHRRIATPGFHHNSIHQQLRSLHKERHQLVANDAGFFNVAGNRLLKLGEMAASKAKTVRLHIHEMAKQISDTKQRAHFLSVLLPMSDLKSTLSNKDVTTELQDNGEYANARAALIEALEKDSEEEPSPGGSENEDDAMDSEDDEDAKMKKDEDLSPPTAPEYPNRPISKEIMENRGIMKYRHKRERNPRVHNRYKYKKALIRYKSRVPEVRKEITPYAGELRGIRAHMVRSQQFKRR